MRARNLSLCTLLSLSLLLPFAAAQTPSASLQLPDGARYKGALLHGQLHGKGRLEWGNGEVYEGEFAHGLMHGRGRMVQPDVYEYEGEFSQGLLHGRGRMVYTHRYEYEGEFLRDEMHGQGRMRYEDGTLYEGAFVKGFMQGQGRLTMPGGMVYEGRFEKDRPKGAGRLTLPDKVVLEGEFDGLDEPPEKGVLIYPKGGRYEGGLAGMMPQGQGVLTLADKTVLRGAFEWGRLQDKGRIEYAGGDVYEGEVRQNQPDGQGRMTRADGSVQNGHWRGGRYLGEKGDGTLPDTPELAGRNNAQALYNQPALLKAQFDKLQRRKSGGPPQMYALYVAGDGREEVFRREVEQIDAFMARRFGTGGRSVSLVNSRSSVQRLPLATEHSIEQALKALAARMDRQRDYLFVYLTSHGSRGHELSMQMPGMRLPDLSAQRLGELLKASGIRNRIVVVSACYSGGFIPALKGPRSWVITASRADRSSFGCADSNDFTYFGRALFEHALPQQPTLSQAFEQASELVRQWEKEGGAPGQPRRPQPELSASTGHGQPGGGAAASAASAVASVVAGMFGLGGQGGDAQLSEPQTAVTPEFRREVDDWLRARAPR